MEAYVFRAVDRSWNEVAVRVIQESVARLAYLGDYMFIGSRFELIGRRDEDGMPLPFAPDSDTVGPHLDDMEILLHRTQCRLDDLRFDHRHTTVANQADCSLDSSAVQVEAGARCHRREEPRLGGSVTDHSIGP